MSVTSAIINFETSWSQKSTEDSNSDNTILDSGKIKYQQEYPSGVPASGIDLIFHESASIVSGSSVSYDLQNLTGTIFDNSFTKTFSKIKSITLNNTADVSGDIDFDVSSASGFGLPFGNPATGINIAPNSVLYIGTKVNSANYVVDSSNKQILLTDVNSTAPSYEIVILGNA